MSTAIGLARRWLLAITAVALGTAACTDASPVAAPVTDAPAAAVGPNTSAFPAGTSTTGIAYTLLGNTGTLIDMLEDGWVVGSTLDGVPALSGVLENVRTGEREVFATYAPALTHAKAVNARREVVGGNPQPFSFPETHAFRWYRGELTDFGTGAAMDVNDAGTIVGYGYPGQAASGVRQPWIVVGGVQHYLDVITGRAMGINNRGDVVGMAMDSATAGVEAPVAWFDGTLTVLVAARGEASDINDRRQVVGWAERADPVPHVEAFVWQAGTVTWLGAAADGYSEAHAINERGQVVGRSVAPDGLVHAMAWYKGQTLDLGLAVEPPEATASEAYGITNSGMVVGRTLQRAGRYGMVWTLPARWR